MLNFTVKNKAFESYADRETTDPLITIDKELGEVNKIKH